MRVILNADDFGYSRDTVCATIECLERKVLSSATIMPKMPFTEQAIAYARQAEGVSFGVHLTFSRDDFESPVLSPELLPTLTDAEGRFWNSRQIRVRALLRSLSVCDVAREMAAQIGLLYDCGIPVSHVDSHGHLHKFGVFRAAMQQVLPKFGIRRVRNVQDFYIRRPLASPTFWLGKWWRGRIEHQFVTTDHLFLPASAHDGPDWTKRFVSAIPSGDKIIEVGLHPGHDESWRQAEYDAAAMLAARATAAGHRIITWDEVT